MDRDVAAIYNKSLWGKQISTFVGGFNETLRCKGGTGYRPKPQDIITMHSIFFNEPR